MLALYNFLLLTAHWGSQEVEDRWEHIASQVEGKTKAQCFKRYGHQPCLNSTAPTVICVLSRV